MGYSLKKGGTEMESEKRQRRSLLLLRLAAWIFGLLTAAELAAAAYLTLGLHAWRGMAPGGAGSVAVIGGADGPTAIYMTPSPLMGLAPFLFALAPVFLAISLVLLNRRGKTGNRA